VLLEMKEVGLTKKKSFVREEEWVGLAKRAKTQGWPPSGVARQVVRDVTSGEANRAGPPLATDKPFSPGDKKKSHKGERPTPCTTRRALFPT
jgi:hypothetical protein